jgi:AcrR family transcriptional regulator
MPTYVLIGPRRNVTLYRRLKEAFRDVPHVEVVIDRRAVSGASHGQRASRRRPIDFQRIVVVERLEEVADVLRRYRAPVEDTAAPRPSTVAVVVRSGIPPTDTKADPDRALEQFRHALLDPGLTDVPGRGALDACAVTAADAWREKRTSALAACLEQMSQRIREADIAAHTAARLGAALETILDSLGAVVVLTHALGPAVGGREATGSPRDEGGGAPQLSLVSRQARGSSSRARSLRRGSGITRRPG